jgi:lambda repressor-like predicted transcriptional regulator
VKQKYMNMRPVDIRIAMLRVGVGQAALAREMKVSRTAIHLVIEGKSTSHRIRTAIAEAIHEDIERIWPATYLLYGGPRKRGRPLAQDGRKAA